MRTSQQTFNSNLVHRNKSKLARQIPKASVSRIPDLFWVTWSILVPTSHLDMWLHCKLLREKARHLAVIKRKCGLLLLLERSTALCALKLLQAWLLFSFRQMCLGFSLARLSVCIKLSLCGERRAGEWEREERCRFTPGSSFCSASWSASSLASAKAHGGVKNIKGTDSSAGFVVTGQEEVASNSKRGDLDWI